ncbi:hypothetical protein E4U55_003169 [Claviceps digitariae]|nr:hypothetical protein E4U55_003169 [Claviceps digitariae]
MRVLEQSTPKMADMLRQHVAQFPEEKEPLVDSATRLGTTTLTPSRKEFIPIGHIAMEAFPDRNEALGLPLSTYWVKSLALQSSGLGRNAMDQLERAASSPPFNCTFLALDTIRADAQKSEELLRGLYDDRGLPRPEVVRTNEEWYLRQGYEIIGGEAEPYEWTVPATGRVLKLPCAFFKKDLRRLDPVGVDAGPEKPSRDEDQVPNFMDSHVTMVKAVNKRRQQQGDQAAHGYLQPQGIRIMSVAGEFRSRKSKTLPGFVNKRP